MAKEMTLREHMKKAAAARWAGKSAEERAAHGRMMREKRAEKEFARDPLLIKNLAKNIVKSKILVKK